ncbi:hypothetical protein [Anaerotignum lactatifermentans]|uniref:hypothetical protein n=1 Tax=Anaerotignum lactatifermentans TaxID=160404 RepID=UPI0018754358|nr:hypothetical protein [Anaerotignum lactatifermentans]MBE5076475.1 hypothetical protein [Anaerotignum lactatifermentans]
MAQKDLRTYRRRGVTRESGYHTCDNTTGGECLITRAERYVCDEDSVTFVFKRSSIDMVELFERGISIIAFGGYIFSEKKATVLLEMQYSYEGQRYIFSHNREKTIEAGNWSNIGMHIEQIINMDSQIFDVIINMTIIGQRGNILDFVSFDFDVVSKEEFKNTSCEKSFYQKTDLHIPYLYYLRTDLPVDFYLISQQKFIKGKQIVLKSCNRCGRYLPINIYDELKTLSFSLHCKKRAPCVHSTFRAYKIENIARLNSDDLFGLKIEDDKVVSYYGHQLECKACKKFFVNAPLNPQRNPQQFKEDGLRRRAIEVLVNSLLERNLIHFEFEHRTKKEFSQFIWEKFDRRCFKCGPDSEPIALEDMALDHTMPLAYLYRLDETATCLCSSHNSQKSDHFPVDYYSEEELVRLSSITGLPLEQLCKKEVNQQVLDLLIKNVVWFYDEFLMTPDYQKVRDGIRTADKINDSLKRIIAGKVDLVEQYRKEKGRYPQSVTIK